METKKIQNREMYIRRLFKDLAKASLIGEHRRRESEKRALVAQSVAYTGVLEKSSLPAPDFNILILDQSYFSPTKIKPNLSDRISRDLKNASIIGQQRRERYMLPHASQIAPGRTSLFSNPNRESK